MERWRSTGILGRFARPRLYQQLADHISDFIEAQGLAPGDHLPPERTLATELGVSRATLSRALVALEVTGRVEVRHGDGAVVSEPVDNATSLATVLAGYPSDQLSAAREAVTRGLVTAAANAPEERRAEIGAALSTGADIATLWTAVRAAAGPSLLSDLDDALLAAGAKLTEEQLPALRRLCEPLASGDATVT